MTEDDAQLEYPLFQSIGVDRIKTLEYFTSLSRKAGSRTGREFLRGFPIALAYDWGVYKAIAGCEYPLRSLRSRWRSWRRLQIWSRVVNLTAAALGAQSDIHPPGAVGGLSKLTHVNL